MTVVFELSRGMIEAYEFPDISFWELEQTAFVYPFIEMTGPIVVISPQKEVLFTVACVLRINYYYLVLQEGLTPKKAFVKTKTFLKKRMTVGFKY